jgi:hypothetical protein
MKVGVAHRRAIDEHIVVFAGSAGFAFHPPPGRDHRDDLTRMDEHIVVFAA